ncbi:very short patch repair endonuclease [Acidobacteriota bacterium]
MVDIVSKEVRSHIMRSVKQRDTKPELAVRRVLKQLGNSYRIRNNDLAGSPDLANRKHRWAIFVNGCFWHGHRNCRKTKSGSGSRIPRHNNVFWQEKLVGNRRRDARKCRELRSTGFLVMIVWECELYDEEKLKTRLRRLLDT